MKPFLGDDFLLESDAAAELYHEHARDLPIIDYHNHLPPQEIAGNREFENMTQAWLAGDHYKWRAMRANGIDESLITGKASDAEKFDAWAATVPYTWRNPLYHWTHLELRRYFGIDQLLNPGTANEIYASCNAALQRPEYRVRGLLEKMNVQLVCTTDDPADSLEYHTLIRDEQIAPRVLPAFRPDKAMQVNNAESFCAYLEKLEAVANVSIENYSGYLEALRGRHDYFASLGCTVSDHGLDAMEAADFTEAEASKAFSALRAGKKLDLNAQQQLRAALLYQFAVWDWEKGWVQQYHLGPLRNTNSRMLDVAGADAGTDSIGDFPQSKSLARFLNRLAKENKLTRTILYNLNPADNALFATMAGNFNDGTVPGKIQWGSAWWFLDQKDGMINQMNTLSQMGLISRFVGMLTDSRSFLSFPRHEYFRRILCNLFGQDMQRGELPQDMDWGGKIIRDICYYNNLKYFGWDLPTEKKAGDD